MLPPDPDDLPPVAADPTGMIATSVPDKASVWLERSDREIRLLISLTSAEAPGERRWTGRHDELPNLRETAKRAAADLIETWPRNIARLIGSIERLANDAAAEWPPTPKPGTTVDGVKIGGRAPDLEYCAECKQPVTGGPDDPIARVDGKPYHRRPCYMTAYMRRQRAGAA